MQANASPRLELHGGHGQLAYLEGFCRCFYKFQMFYTCMCKGAVLSPHKGSITCTVYLMMTIPIVQGPQRGRDLG